MSLLKIESQISCSLIKWPQSPISMSMILTAMPFEWLIIFSCRKVSSWLFGMCNTPLWPSCQGGWIWDLTPIIQDKWMTFGGASTFYQVLFLQRGFHFLKKISSLVWLWIACAPIGQKLLIPTKRLAVCVNLIETPVAHCLMH